MNLNLLFVLLAFATVPVFAFATWQLNVGVMYSSTGTYVYPFSYLKQHAASMWMTHENTHPSGLNATYGIEVQIFWYDVGTTSSILNATKDGVDYLIHECNVTAIFPPQDAVAIDYAASLAQEYQVLVLTGSSADSNIFRSMHNGYQVRRYLNAFTTMTPASDYVLPVLDLLHKQPYALKTVAYLTTQLPIHLQVTLGSTTAATKIGYSIVAEETISIASLGNMTLEFEEVQRALQRIYALEPKLDLLIVATWFACTTIPTTLQQLQFSPAATFLWECPNQITTFSAQEQVLLQDFFTVSQSDPRLTGNEYTDDATSRGYATLFPPTESASSIQNMLYAFNLAQVGLDTAVAGATSDTSGTGTTFEDVKQVPILKAIPYNALFGSELAAFYILDFAVVESIQSISSTFDVAQWSTIALQDQRKLLTARAQAVNIMSFFGKISIVNGMNSLKPMVVLQVLSPGATTPSGSQLGLVYPDASTETVESICPMPAWNERKGVYAIFGTTAEQVVILGITSVLCLGSVLTLAGFIIFRQRPQIRAATPSLTIVMVIGCLMCFASVFTWAHNNTQLACTTRMPLTTLGFSVVMWSVILKIYRILKIFNSNSAIPVKLSNARLMMYLAVVISMVIIIFGTWWIQFPLSSQIVVVDPLRVSLNYLECQGNEEQQQVQQVFWGVLAFYVVGVLAIACHFALQLNNQIRSLSSSSFSYDDFNDSKSIAYVVYNTVVGILLVIILQYAENEANRSVIMVARALLLNVVFGIMMISLAGYKVISACFMKTTQVLSPSNLTRVTVVHGSILGHVVAMESPVNRGSNMQTAKVSPQSHQRQSSNPPSPLNQPSSTIPPNRPSPPSPPSYNPSRYLIVN